MSIMAIVAVAIGFVSDAISKHVSLRVSPKFFLYKIDSPRPTIKLADGKYPSNKAFLKAFSIC